MNRHPDGPSARDQKRQLDEAYDVLRTVLIRQGHAPECAYRCLDDSGRCDHSCRVCAQLDRGRSVPERAPLG
jgi:hypothetical protein